jgi:branched-chain amino acid transport system substrate-binding protein
MTISATLKILLAASGVSLALFAPARSDAIKIGEINSYSGLPAFTEPYRKGWQLALEEINAEGGVDGKKLVVISKDDGGKPAEAVTAANELVSDDGVALLAGTFFSNVGLAVSDFAAQKKVMFLAAEPLTDAITWSKGNRYTFRLRPSNSMQASMLADEAAKLPAKRWATIAPNYEYGQSAVAAFKKLLSEKRPDIQWVGEQWPPQGKIDAGPVLEAIDATGWIVTGYPWSDVKIPEHAAFLKAYQDKYHDYPRLGSIVGYSMMKAIAAILAKAQSTETDKLIAAAEGIEVETPFGQVTFRAIDHQSTMGAFVGKTALKDGAGVMVDTVYRSGADYLPPDDVVRSLRPQN